MLDTGELVIHEGNYQQFLEGTHAVNGVPVRTGGRPRDYTSHPVGCYGERTTLDMPTIPSSEIEDRLKIKVAEKSLLSDIRATGRNGQRIPARDQNGKGYCWQHSGVSAMMLLRAVKGEPYADLSAYGPACIQKQFQDEGGWGAAGVDFLVSRGCPTSKTWPQQSMSRSNDNPATWEEAKKFRITEGFIDLGAAQYDRKLTWEQFATCLLCNVPVVSDYNWWSHSVCAMDLVSGAAIFVVMRSPVSGKRMKLQEFERVWKMDGVTGGMGGRILNSWGDSWSDGGQGILAPSKFFPDGAVAPRDVTASLAA